MIGSIFIDGADANAATSNTPDLGRDIAAADVQHWDGVQWITIASVGGGANYAVSFPAPVTTTAIRLNDIQTSGIGYGVNSVIYELFVFHAVSCPVPSGT